MPDNLNQVKKFDDFVGDILKYKHEQKHLDMNFIFEKNQSKNASVMGPLSKLWMLVEDARKSKEKQIPIDLDNITAYIEKTVLLLGQSSNCIIFFGRYNILVAPNRPAELSRRSRQICFSGIKKIMFDEMFNEHFATSAK